MFIKLALDDKEIIADLSKVTTVVLAQNEITLHYPGGMAAIKRYSYAGDFDILKKYIIDKVRPDEPPIMPV